MSDFFPNDEVDQIAEDGLKALRRRQQMQGPSLGAPIENVPNVSYPDTAAPSQPTYSEPFIPQQPLVQESTMQPVSTADAPQDIYDYGFRVGMGEQQEAPEFRKQLETNPQLASEYKVGLAHGQAKSYSSAYKQYLEDFEKSPLQTPGEEYGKFKSGLPMKRPFNARQFAKWASGVDPVEGGLQGAWDSAYDVYKQATGPLTNKVADILTPQADYERIEGDDKWAGYQMSRTAGNVYNEKLEKSIEAKDPGPFVVPKSMPEPEDIAADPEAYDALAAQKRFMASLSEEERGKLEEDNKPILEAGWESIKDIYTNRSSREQVIQGSAEMAPISAAMAGGAGLLVKTLGNAVKTASRLNKLRKAGKRGYTSRTGEKLVTRVEEQLRRSDALESFKNSIIRKTVPEKIAGKVKDQVDDAFWEVMTERVIEGSHGAEGGITTDQIVDGIMAEMVEETAFLPLVAGRIANKFRKDPSSIPESLKEFFTATEGVSGAQADLVGERMAGTSLDLDMANVTEDRARIAEQVMVPNIENETTSDLQYRLRPEARKLTAEEAADVEGYEGDVTGAEIRGQYKNVPSSRSAKGAEKGVSGDVYEVTGGLGADLENISVEETVHFLQNRLRGTETGARLKKWEQEAAKEYRDRKGGSFSLSGDELSAQAIAQAITGRENTPGVGQFAMPPELEAEVLNLLPDQWRKREGRVGRFGRKVDLTSGATTEGDLKQAANARFSLAGVEESKTVDRNKLAQAQMMDARGLDPEVIWTKTGFVKNPRDGKWRYEISNRDVDITPLLPPKGQEQQIGTLAQIPGLEPVLEAYPRLANTDVILRRSMPEKYKDALPPAAYMKGRGDIQNPSAKDKPLIVLEGVAGVDTKVLNGVLLHELQHAIQETEGFAPGSNPDVGAKKRAQKIRATERNLKDYTDFANLYDAVRKERLKGDSKSTTRMREEATAFLEEFASPGAWAANQVRDARLLDDKQLIEKRDTMLKDAAAQREQLQQLKYNTRDSDFYLGSSGELEAEEVRDRYKQGDPEGRTVIDFDGKEAPTPYTPAEHREIDEFMGTETKVRQNRNVDGGGKGRLPFKDNQGVPDAAINTDKGVKRFNLQRDAIPQEGGGPKEGYPVYHNATVKFLTEGKGKNQNKMTLSNWAKFLQKSGVKGVGTPEEMRLSGLTRMAEEYPDKVYSREKLIERLKANDVRGAASMYEVRTEDVTDQKAEIEEFLTDEGHRLDPELAKKLIAAGYYTGSDGYRRYGSISTGWETETDFDSDTPTIVYYDRGRVDDTGTGLAVFIKFDESVSDFFYNKENVAQYIENAHPEKVYDIVEAERQERFERLSEEDPELEEYDVEDRTLMEVLKYMDLDDLPKDIYNDITPTKEMISYFSEDVGFDTEFGFINEDNMNEGIDEIQTFDVWSEARENGAVRLVSTPDEFLGNFNKIFPNMKTTHDRYTVDNLVTSVSLTRPQKLAMVKADLYRDPDKENLGIPFRALQRTRKLDGSYTYEVPRGSGTALVYHVKPVKSVEGSIDDVEAEVETSVRTSRTGEGIVIKTAVKPEGVSVSDFVESEHLDFMENYVPTVNYPKKDGRFQPTDGAVNEMQQSNMSANFRNFTIGGGADVDTDYRTILLKTGKVSEGYEDAHWKGNNTIAFARLTSREVDGQPAVFIEETQSDWESQVRGEYYDQETGKEYRTKTDKDGKKYTEEMEVGHYPTTEKRRMPFQNTWTSLMAKRLITEAVEKGVTRIAWTTPEQQAERYSVDLNRNVNNLVISEKEVDGEKRYGVHFRAAGKRNEYDDLTRQGLANIIGSGMADHLIDRLDQDGTEASGDYTKMYAVTPADQAYVPVGVGMAHQYRRALPKAFEEILKPYLGKKNSKPKYGKLGQTSWWDGDLAMESTYALKRLGELDGDTVNLAEQAFIRKAAEYTEKYSKIIRDETYASLREKRDINLTFPKEDIRNAIEASITQPYIDLPPELVEDVKKEGLSRYNLKRTTDKDLIGIHNTKPENVEQLLTDGMVTPSIAVTKRGVSHTGFGDVSFVLHKDVSDPKKRGGRVYRADAYTPRMPRFSPVYKSSDVKELKNTVNSYLPKDKQVKWDIKPEDGSIYVGDQPADPDEVLNISNAYLISQGKKPVEKAYERQVPPAPKGFEVAKLFVQAFEPDSLYLFENPKTAGSLSFELRRIARTKVKDAKKTDELFSKAVRQYAGIQRVKDLETMPREEANTLFKDAVSDYTEMFKDSKAEFFEVFVFGEDSELFKGIFTHLKGAEDAPLKEDRFETRNRLREAGAEEWKVADWLKSLLPVSHYTFTKWDDKKQQEVKRKATPANVLKYMREVTGGDPRAKEAFMGSDRSRLPVFRAAAGAPFANVGEMRAEKGRITKFDKESKEVEELRKRLDDVLQYTQTQNRQEWAADILVDYANSRRDEAAWERYKSALKKDLNVDLFYRQEEIDSLVDDIIAMPTDYYESLPDRVVKPEEVEYMVMDQSTWDTYTKDQKKRIEDLAKENNIEVIISEAGRSEAIDAIESSNVRFNLKRRRDDAKKMFEEAERINFPERSLARTISETAKAVGIVGVKKEDVIAMAMDPGTAKTPKMKEKARQLQESLEMQLDQLPNNGFDRQEETIGDYLSDKELILDRVDIETGAAMGIDDPSLDWDKALVMGEISDVDYSTKKKVKVSDLVKSGPNTFSLDGLVYAVRSRDGETLLATPQGGLITIDYDDEVYTDTKREINTALDRKEVSRGEHIKQLEDIIDQYTPGEPEYEEAMHDLSLELQQDRTDMLIQEAKEEAVMQARLRKNGQDKKIDPQLELNLRLEAAERTTPGIVFELPEPNRRERFYQKMVDRFDGILRLEREIIKSGGTVDKAKAPYRTLELYPGRADEAIRKIDNVANQAVDIMVKKKITPEEMSDFLYAQHAPERNASMAEKNEGAQGLSGMTNKEAEDLLHKFEAEGKLSTMKAIYKLLRRERDRVNKEMVESGLRLEEVQDGYDDAWDFYVPLKGIEDKVKAARGGSGRTRGYTARNTDKEALGRVSKATHNVMAQYIADMAAHTVQVEKARVGRSLYKLAVDNPNPAFWEINPKRTKAKFDKQTMRVEQVPDPYRPEEPNVFPALGPDGEVNLIVFNTPEGVELARMINGMDQESSNVVIQYSGRLNGFLGSLLTSYNPPFVISNAIRDGLTAIFNIGTERTMGEALKTVGKAPGAALGVYRDRKGRFAGEWGKYWQEMQEAGGKTGFAAVPQIEEKVEELEKKYKLSSATWKNPVNFGRKGWSDFLDIVEDMNTAVENAVRLSHYRILREKGASKEEAASAAKNLTVNFNRKGEYGGDLNKVFMFFNAAVQGTDRIYQSARRNPKKFAAMMGALSTLGFTLGMYNQMVSGDDEESGVTYWEKVPDYTKASNIVVMIPGGKGKHIKIPLPYGHNAFYSVGQRLADMSFNPRSNRTNQAFGMVNDMVNATNPIGSSSLATSISPTVIRPIIELDRNQNFAGNPIYRTQSSMARGPAPNSHLYFRSTARPFRFMSEKLNQLSGGTAEVSGKVDIYPDALEHMYEFFTGGTGKFVKNTWQTLDNATQGVFMPEKTPFISKVYGADNPYFDQATFYNQDNNTKAIMQKGRQPYNRAVNRYREAYKEFDGDIPDSVSTLINREADSLLQTNYGYVVLESFYNKVSTKVLPKIRKAIKNTKNPKSEKELERDVMKLFNRVKMKVTPLQNKLDRMNSTKTPEAKKIMKAIDKVVEKELEMFDASR